MVDPKSFGTKVLLLLYLDGTDFILTFLHGECFCTFVCVLSCWKVAQAHLNASLRRGVMVWICI
jgi:hypothetical protein